MIGVLNWSLISLIIENYRDGMEDEFVIIFRLSKFTRLIFPRKEFRRFYGDRYKIVLFRFETRTKLRYLLKKAFLLTEL